MYNNVHIMTISYSDIKPWGRSLREYLRMFSLTPADLKLDILGCGDGPASFNAEMTRQGGRVTSVDPIYRFTAEQLRQRILETYEDVIGQTRANADRFVWDEIRSVDELGQIRMAAMDGFLADFEQGKLERRYLAGELPTLPFGDRDYDLALCSHFLFLYTDNLTLDFHLDSVKELCRVAREVRIFPVLDANAGRSPYVDPVIELSRSLGLQAVEEKVSYEFQKGGNTMLRITSK